MGGASAETVKENALKEELYRDLTGLIITSVKRKDDEDEYSCIQTGRNGSKSCIDDSLCVMDSLTLSL